MQKPTPNSADPTALPGRILSLIRSKKTQQKNPKPSRCVFLQDIFCETSSSSLINFRRMTILIIGARGRLGACLSRAFTQAGHHVIPFDRTNLNLTTPTLIENILTPLSYDLVLICAAATNLDWCEQNPTAAQLINVTSPEKIAHISHQKNARVLFFSTDYVYDGRQPGLKSETSPLSPISVYAQNKLDAENVILTSTAHQALILRISWLFGPDRPAFPEYVINLARQGKPLSIIADKFSSPTYAPDVANLILTIVNNDTIPQGVFNYSNLGETSWYDYAQQILKIAIHRKLCPTNPKLLPVTLEKSHHLIAPRPKFTAIDSKLIVKKFNLNQRSWLQALADYLSSYKTTI
jgi:dTDP-4-dehydrorhamnose reductase